MINRILSTIALALFSCTVAAATPPSSSSKLDLELVRRARSAPSSETTSVIVTLNAGGQLSPEFRRYARRGPLGLVNGYVLDVPNGLLAVRIESVPGNNAGDMRAVTVVVIRQRATVHEILEVGDALIAVRIKRRASSPDREVVVKRADAGIDDRNADPLAGHPHQAPNKEAAACH